MPSMERDERSASRDPSIKTTGALSASPSVVVVHDQPIVERTPIHVKCRVPCRFLKRQFISERHSVYLAVIDAGAIRSRMLQPNEVIKRKMLSKEFVCCPRTRLMASSDWQQVDVSIRPLLFTAGGADVLLCLVVESSVLGRDMWVLAGYTPVSVQQDLVIRDAAAPAARAPARAAAAVSRDERAAATAAAAALLEKLCSLRRLLADVPRSGELAELVKCAQDELRQRFSMDMQTGGSPGGMSSQTVERTVSGFPYLEFASFFSEYLHDMVDDDDDDDDDDEDDDEDSDPDDNDDDDHQDRNVNVDDNQHGDSM